MGADARGKGFAREHRQLGVSTLLNLIIKFPDLDIQSQDVEPIRIFSSQQ